MKKIITTILLAAMLSTGLTNAAKASSVPFLGEIMIAGFGYCPSGWARADGQLLPISQYQALFSLIGTSFGGDGRTNFALPDLRGRNPVHVGTGPGLPAVNWGEAGGSTSFTLTTAQLPSHNHTSSVFVKQGRGVSTGASAKFLAESGIYRSTGTNVSLNAGSITIGNTGSNQAVQKRSPYLGMTHCISLQGVFPSMS